MDMLDLAKERFVEMETERAIAAALIAQVEAMHAKPQFVQVGDQRLNVADISQVEDFGTHINVYMRSGPTAQLKGDIKQRFVRWIDDNADVVLLDMPDIDHNGPARDAATAECGEER